jgi:hypothetical protein
MARGDLPLPGRRHPGRRPWFSNEERKIVSVLDIADHAKDVRRAFGFAWPTTSFELAAPDADRGVERRSRRWPTRCEHGSS